jgi:ABC-type phosphate transport system substrate-binding protein
MVGIVALVALLYTIVNSAFGYVAIQNSIDPQELVLSVEEARMLSAPNLVSSEDDEVLAQGVASSPDAIGFFGYAYYQGYSDELRLLSLDGVAPSADSVDSGQYDLARPLFIYTTASIMEDKPQVSAFVHHYLAHVNDEIVDVGYFPASDQAMERSTTKWEEVTGTAPPSADPLSGDVLTAGSSTVYPLSQRMAERFQATGFAGDITVESIGSSAGLRRFCIDGDIDVANASRAIKRSEAELCNEIKRVPIEFRVGTDAVAVVVSQANDFLTGVSKEQLRQIFTTANTWADVVPSWPDRPIERYIPGIDSGTLDFFVEQVYERELQDLPKETLVAILQANVSKGLFRRFENDMPFAERSQEDVYELVLDRVVEPQIVETWSLYDSVFKRAAIRSEVAAKYP